MEELKAKTEEEERKKKAINEKLQKEKQQFFKDQKLKIKKDFKDKINERKELQNLESELEYQKDIKKKQIKENMVNYLKNHKEDRDIELRQREEIYNFYQMNEEIFEENENVIGKIFRHYCKANVKTIDNKLENNVNSINKEEFVKFGKNTQIVPKLLSSEVLLHIFTLLAKERLEKAGPDDELGLVLDYASFEKGLILIAIEGREILGGFLKPKEEEKYTSRYKIGTRNKSRERSEEHSGSPPQKKAYKTLAGKKIKELHKKKPTYGTEIKDIKIGKQFDPSSISAETLESLISFIGEVKI